MNVNVNVPRTGRRVCAAERPLKMGPPRAAGAGRHSWRNVLAALQLRHQFTARVPMGRYQ